MKSKKKIKESKEKKVPFCPHCKKIIRRFIIREEVWYTDSDIRESDISFDENDELSIDDTDWERTGNGDTTDSNINVMCGNCGEDITDIIEETVNGYFRVDYTKENLECISTFFKNGNKTLDEVMVELL